MLNNFHSIGVTSDLKRRLKTLNFNGINSDKYKYKTVYFETYENSNKAIQRENKLNKIPKELILELVKNNNPLLTDLTNL